MKLDSSFASKIISNRYCQLLINEHIKNKIFRIPIHLALGHEIIAEAIFSNVDHNDCLVCTHRNIHYHLASGAALNDIINEFSLKEEGVAGGAGGSMNLTNPDRKISYTSSILGNNLCVGAGVALAKKQTGNSGVVYAITGDGAIEEGAFYESVLNACALGLPIIYIVENNNWSLASSIEERRKPIDLKIFAKSLGAQYTNLSGNDFEHYSGVISEAKNRAVTECLPCILEVRIETLGGRWVDDDKTGSKRYINYHAGATSEADIANDIILKNDECDPLYVLRKQIGTKEFNKIVADMPKFLALNIQ